MIHNGIVIINNNKINIPFDTDAKKFIYAAGLDSDANINSGGLYDAERARMAVNFLISNYKYYGLWSKNKAVYPVIGGNDWQHAINAKDPRNLDVAKRIIFLGGGWVHSGTGSKPNGSSSYADTFTKPSEFPQNSCHLSFYTKTDYVGEAIDMGSNGLSGADISDFQIAINWSGGLGNLSRLNGSYINSGYTPTPNYGLFLINRVNNLTDKKYQNRVLKEQDNIISVAPNSVDITLSARRGELGDITFFSPRECSFSSIGEGLTDYEVYIKNKIDYLYQQFLNRGL